MAGIPIDDLECGMVPTHDIVGKNGRLLVAGGVTLGPSHLRILRIWGVTEVEVTASGPQDVREPETDPARLAAARDQANAQFRLTDREHPAMAELFRLRVVALATAEPPIPDFQADPGDDNAPLPPAPPDPEALIAADPSLASFSDVYFRLQEALDDPAASAGRMADIIGRDPGLAASLLRLANSPFYGFSKRIDSLTRGVMLIGAGELALLALGISVAGKFQNLPPGCVTLRQTWEHAVGCGVLARLLATQIRGLPQERAFVAGLLHDTGRLVLLRLLPRHMARVVRVAREEAVPLRRAEQAVLGYDHAAVGRTLLTRWSLPPGLCAAVGDHHAPDGADPDTALVHLANCMAISQAIGANGSPLVPPLEPVAWTALGLPVSSLAVALSQARRQVSDLVAMLAV
jgi:HD-like signal output (HDOD) protein